ncbi:MAG: lipid-A-disaccharide synthase [Bdellovibrionota bacterium]
MTKPRVMIIAAEASSSHYALRLLKEWKSQGLDVEAFGVGSKDMENIGFRRLGKSEEMAIVGAAEIISQLGFLKSVMDQLVEEAVKLHPQVTILMDYPEFNLLLARKLRARGLRSVYYISPQIWAWRQGRVETIKKFCDKVFLLFPFEKHFYEKHSVPLEFVGHPLLDEMDEKYFDPKYLQTRRAQYGFTDSDIVLGLMPGSRRLELKQHFEIQLETARRLIKKFPQIRIVILCAPTFEKEELHAYLEDFKSPYVLLRDDPFSMIHIVDLMLVASGTATLQVGLLQKPMIIMYRMKWLTSVFASLFVRGAKFFGLVNLILDREVAPEKYQAQANPEVLENELSKLITDENYRFRMIKELGELRFKLGDRGATRRVAESIRKTYFEGNP